MYSIIYLFIKLDCSLVEINPLVITDAGDVHCLDAKINVDGNALYRQAGLRSMRDISQEDAREVQADAFGLNYVALDGDIGCMVNGAGLAMGTMDLVKLHGGNPANFLDVGGGARPSLRRSRLFFPTPMFVPSLSTFLVASFLVQPLRKGSLRRLKR